MLGIKYDHPGWSAWVLRKVVEISDLLDLNTAKCNG
jgi:hypothetical protein